MLRRIAVLCLLLGGTGCLWRGYATIMGVHLDVLTQMATKLCSVIEAGAGPTAEAMAEYTYPAQRGREFLRQFGGYDARPSYQEFGRFLDGYEAMVRTADAARAQGRDWRTVLPPLKVQRDGLLQLASAIRADLKRE